MCMAGQRVSLTTTGPGPSLFVYLFIWTKKNSPPLFNGIPSPSGLLPKSEEEGQKPEINKASSSDINHGFAFRKKIPHNGTAAIEAKFLGNRSKTNKFPSEWMKDAR